MTVGRTFRHIQVVDGDERTSFCFTDEGREKERAIAGGGAAISTLRLSRKYTLSIPGAMKPDEMILKFDKRFKMFTSASYIQMFVTMTLAQVDIEAIEHRAGIGLLLG